MRRSNFLFCVVPLFVVDLRARAHVCDREVIARGDWLDATIAIVEQASAATPIASLTPSPYFCA